MAALLFHRASPKDAWLGWPAEVREGLAQASRAGVAQDLLVSHHLAELVEALFERGSPCLLMKGEALAVSHYPEPGTRSRSDTDLFIRPKDIERVRRTVLDLGYEIRTPVYAGREFTVMRRGDASGNIRFDLHWRILNTPRFARVLTFEQAFERSVPVPGLGRARMLGDADALLVACLHRLGSKSHDPDRLIWLHDIFVIASGMTDSDWMRFCDTAVRHRVQEPCRNGLITAGVYFDYPLPAGVLAQLGRPADDEAADGQSLGASLDLFLADWRDLGETRSRLKMLRELVLPSPSLVLSKYGKTNLAWLPLLYIRRAVSGMLKGVTSG